MLEGVKTEKLQATTYKILAETHVGSAEKQLTKDKLIYLLTVRFGSNLGSSKPDWGLLVVLPTVVVCVVIGFFQALSPLTVREG
jgi:hypothetical protein